MSELYVALGAGVGGKDVASGARLKLAEKREIDGAVHRACLPVWRFTGATQLLPPSRLNVFMHVDSP